MSQSKKTCLKLMGLFLLLAAAMTFTFGMPKQVSAAKKTYTFMFTPGSTGKIKVKGNKLCFYDTKAYVVDTGKTINGSYYAILTKKTKYQKVVNTETGKKKSVKKKTALNNLKKKKFIAMYLTVYKKSSKTKTILFGV